MVFSTWPPTSCQSVLVLVGQPVSVSYVIKRFDLARIRTWNLLIRSQTRYPLRHKTTINYEGSDGWHLPDVAVSVKLIKRKATIRMARESIARLDRVLPPGRCVLFAEQEKGLNGTSQCFSLSLTPS